jgi:hypothetical protein
MSERPAWVRPAVLAAAGAATFAVAYQFSGSGSDGVVDSVARTGNSAAGTVAANAGAGSTPAGAAPSAPAAPAAPNLPLRSRIPDAASKDPFAAHGWLPPPPPAPPPLAEAPAPPPPPPTAPPVPFRFVGLLEEKSAKPAAFIAKGDALYVVHVGDVVESTYRVESFNSAQVVITYLPLQQRQTIEVNGG